LPSPTSVSRDVQLFQSIKDKSEAICFLENRCHSQEQIDSFGRLLCNVNNAYLCFKNPMHNQPCVLKDIHQLPPIARCIAKKRPDIFQPHFTDLVAPLTCTKEAQNRLRKDAKFQSFEEGEISEQAEKLKRQATFPTNSASCARKSKKLPRGQKRDVNDDAVASENDLLSVIDFAVRPKRKKSVRDIEAKSRSEAQPSGKKIVTRSQSRDNSEVNSDSSTNYIKRNLCRLCGKNCSFSAYNLFTPASKKKDIVDKILFTCDVVVSREDPVSVRICQQCLDFVLKMVDYVKRCQSTQARLWEHVLTSDKRPTISLQQQEMQEQQLQEQLQILQVQQQQQRNELQQEQLQQEVEQQEKQKQQQKQLQQQQQWRQQWQQQQHQQQQQMQQQQLQHQQQQLRLLKQMEQQQQEEFLVLEKVPLNKKTHIGSTESCVDQSKEYLLVASSSRVPANTFTQQYGEPGPKFNKKLKRTRMKGSAKKTS